MIDWLGGAILLAWIAIILLAFGLSGILREVRELRGFLAGSGPEDQLSIGKQLSAEVIRLVPLDEPGIHVLLLASTTCLSCEEVVPAALALPDRLPTLTVTVAFRESQSKWMAQPPSRVVQSDAAFESLGVEIVPFAVVMDSHGRVLAAEPVGSRERLEMAVSLPHTEHG